MSKEFKVGLLAITASVMMYFGFNFLRGVDFFSPTNKYYTVYHHIDGLTISNPVVINGMAVGRVSDMKILPNQGNKILVELDVDEHVEVRTSSRAKLTSTDFLGSKAIQIETGDGGALLENGDTLTSFIDGGLAEIMQKAEPLTDNLGVTISSINKILKGMQGSGEVLKSSLEKLDTTLSSVSQLIAASKWTIPQTIKSYNQLGDSLQYLISDLRFMVKVADSTMQKTNELDLKKIEKSLTDLSDNLNVMVTEMTRGGGSLGKLIQEDSLYDNLNHAAENLDKLFIHMNKHPKHFMGPLGKKSSKIKKNLEKEERQ